MAGRRIAGSDVTAIALDTVCVSQTADGADHPAPAGTFVRVDPQVTRTIRNDGDEPVDLLIVSAPRTSGYEPMGWA